MDSCGHGSYFQRSMASKVLAGLNYRYGSYFQRSMASKVRTGLIYIDDVLIHGPTEAEFLTKLRKVFQRLRDHNVAANPKKTKLGLTQVEDVGHLISAESTSFTKEKRLKLWNFPLP